MLKNIIQKGDPEYLDKLMSVYCSINDEKNILKISGKILLKAKYLTREKLIELFDRIYQIISKYRKNFKSLEDLELIEKEKNRFDKARYLGEYKQILRTQITTKVKKVIKSIKRAIANIDEKDYEKLLFFNLNLADYHRYLCEVSVSDVLKEDNIKDCEDAYLKLFKIFEDQSIAKVNPCRVTACYHYTIFLYEICNKKTEAITKLKEYHQDIIENLDTAYKVYLETYELLTIITENLTNWIINRNSIANVQNTLEYEGEIVY